jgi:hypothetical protein
MEHLSLKGLLEKFSKIIGDATDLKLKIQEIIKEYTQIEISVTQITIKNNTIYLKVSGNIKNEVYIYQTQILEKLEKEYGKKSPNKIIF